MHPLATHAQDLLQPLGVATRRKPRRPVALKRQVVRREAHGHVPGARPVSRPLKVGKQQAHVHAHDRLLPKAKDAQRLFVGEKNPAGPVKDQHNLAGELQQTREGANKAPLSYALDMSF